MVRLLQIMAVIDDKIAIVRKHFTQDHYRKTGKNAIKTYYERYKPFDSTITISTEERVHLKLDQEGTYDLIGFIDRLAKAQDGTIEIHDYKTSKNLPSQYDLDNDRQLALYQLAIQSRWPDVKNMKLIWHYLVHDTEMTSTRTEEQLEKVRGEVLAAINKIENTTEFEPNESALCSWCDYQELCPLRKHMFKTEVMPKSEFKKDDGVSLVDEYMAVKDKITVAKSEQEKLEERIYRFAEENEVAQIRGTDHVLKVKSASKLKFPAKTQDEMKYDEFRSILEQHGIWSEISQLNIHALRAKLESVSCDPALRDDLAPFMEHEEQKKITASKLKSNDDGNNI